MIKKIICKIVGHQTSSFYCPYTKISYIICQRCNPKEETEIRFK